MSQRPPELEEHTMNKRKKFESIHASGESAGMIYRGKSYTKQETEALEKIQREHAFPSIRQLQ
jgi:hypothetical protein